MVGDGGMTLRMTHISGVKEHPSPKFDSQSVDLEITWEPCDAAKEVVLIGKARPDVRVL